jgi:drug/metabolite transporter (DMT)-like permease
MNSGSYVHQHETHVVGSQFTHYRCLDLVKYCSDTLCADYISPVSISFYRWLVAFIILTPFMLSKVWQQRDLIRQHFVQFAVLSAFGMFLYQGLAYSAAHYTTATNMGIINAFIPVFTIFVSMIF